MTTAETVSGTVEARNERGIRVQGEWRNLSKFRPLELPEVGATVRLGLDPKGFINTLEVVDGVHSGVESGAYSSTSLRDRQIARLSVLKSAAAFAAGRDDIKSSDVLLIADRWLAWVEAD